MIPALFTRISRREDAARKDSAAVLTEARSLKSISKCVILAFGTLSLMDAMASSAFDRLLAPRKICGDPCLANCKQLSAPSPELPK